ncbi:pro-neuregulin-4, membrane-bound isoform [Pteronotus mesoamericanus]|uniref:pro-neuregulin-4, membrane-bound isoform n=1 Tax=Pteronotus mesoamericanus TaxID=1884717 RepID=UPI0023EE003F|nr:pro-neuregulin-4, membrane-bound isoform [Pteronotus parnellii mesoamericanus]
MPTDHEEPCGPSHRPFCLNGGTCYVVSAVPGPFCRCIDNYTGARCEEVFLPSTSTQGKPGLLAASVALAVLLGALLVGALYCLCRKGCPQRASAVQHGLSLAETSRTSAQHSHGEH